MHAVVATAAGLVSWTYSPSQCAMLLASFSPCIVDICMNRSHRPCMKTHSNALVQHVVVVVSMHMGEKGEGSWSATFHQQQPSLPPPVALWDPQCRFEPTCPIALERESNFAVVSHSYRASASPTNKALSPPAVRSSRTFNISKATVQLLYPVFSLSIPRPALFKPPSVQNVYPSLLRHLQVGQRRKFGAPPTSPAFVCSPQRGHELGKANSREAFLLTWPFPF